MTDTNVKLFKGDGVAENATDFLNAIRRRILLGSSWSEDEKVEYFELSLKDGSYASNWFSKLSAADKKTFKDLVAAFRLQWPAKEMAEKSKGEVQEELLGMRLAPGEVGVRVEDDGILEWGHVRWALKVADLGARVDPGGGLIAQALKNIPDSLLLHLGPERDTWPELVQAMKDIPPSNIASIRRQEERFSAMETQLTSANATIAAMQQTPTRGLTAAFSGMAASSPARARADPVRRNLFPPTNAKRPPQQFRPDQERLQMITASPVIIHPYTPAGQAAYAQQITTYTQRHGTGKPSEDRPYPLTPGTVAVGSGECHQCGQVGHFFDRCNAAAERHVPEVEMRWRRIVQSIISRIAREQRNPTAINVVADASDDGEGDVFGAFGSAEYDQNVIEEFLARGKGQGLSV